MKENLRPARLSHVLNPKNNFLLKYREKMIID